MSPHAIRTSHWLIQPEALDAIVASADNQQAGFLDALLGKQEAPAPILSVSGGIATIEISGPLMRKPDAFDRAFNGATGFEQIGDAIRECATRPDVVGVMLNIDSPGGTVAGTPELAAAVAELNASKPVYAFTSGTMASAAYWIASQARAIYATPSARVGSIGVVQTVIDRSAMLEKAGVKVEVFSVGKYKAMGAPGTQLTEDHRAHIQATLQEIASDFHAAVRSNRKNVPDSAMEGQTFHSRAAAANGLLTAVVRDQGEAMRRLKFGRPAVDTKAKAEATANRAPITMTIEEQLAKLEADHQAQADLLTEASAKIVTLESAVAAKDTELATAKEQLETVTGTVAAKDTEIAALKTAQTEFDKKLQLEVARVVAATGSSTPAAVTGAAKVEGEPITRAQMKDMTPQAIAAHFRNGGKVTD